MFNYLLRLLRIKPGEVFLLILTSLQAICIGVFLSTFDIGTHAIFLESYPADQIPFAFIVSGLFGIVLMLFYTFISSRMRSRHFAIINYLIIGTGILFLFYYTEYQDLIQLSVMGFPLMLPYTLMFPLNIMVLLNFWKSIKEIFIQNQSQRLHPYVRMAQIGGMVLGSYGVILFLFISWNLELIILGSAASIITVLILQLIINPVYRYSTSFLKQPKKKNIIRSKFHELFYTKYTFLLVLFVFLSALTGISIHYLFISMTRDFYPYIVGFAKYLGLFVGTLFIFIFILEKLLIRKILYAYDSPYSILLIPVAIILFCGIALLMQILIGQAVYIARFTVFFLTIALLKMGYEAAKSTIELPSLRVLVQSLDIRFKNAIIPRIEGSLRLLSIIFGGLIIIGLIQIKFNRPQHIIYTIILLCVLWFFVTVKLIKAYQNALKNYIKKIRTNIRAKEHDLPGIDKYFHRLLNSDDPEKVINTLSISENIEPISFEKHLIDLLNINSTKVRRFLLWKINNLSVINSLNALKNLKFNAEDKSSKNLRTNIISVFEKKLTSGKTVPAIEKLVNSKKISDRILASELLGHLDKEDKLTTLLVNLSRDFEPEVKFAAIRSMARVSNPNHTHILIGYLSSPLFYTYAYEALIRIGDDALDQLEQVFLLTESDNVLLSRVVKIYGKIGSPRAIELLLNKIENQNRTIVRQAIISLRESGFQATPTNINRILNTIVRILNIMSWNMTAIAHLENINSFPMLRNALTAELTDNYKVLFHLLSLAYNSTAIANIRNLIYQGNDTDISFAIEMLDQIVNEDIKQVLFPVLENLTTKGRIKKLQYFFQTEKVLTNELIPEIITRDYNLISLYLKSCAIISLLDLRKPEIDEVLVSNLFHPHKLIRETAAYVINRIDSNYLDAVLPRMEPAIVHELMASLEQSKNGSSHLIIHRVHFLRQCQKFQGVPEYVLLELARNLEIYSIEKDNEIKIDRHEKTYSLLIVLKGSVELIAEGRDNFTFRESDLIYTNAIANTLDSKFIIKSNTYTEMYGLENESLNMLIFDYRDIRRSILDCIDEL
jgi:AAA family ATP:ADP antiporter